MTDFCQRVSSRLKTTLICDKGFDKSIACKFARTSENLAFTAQIFVKTIAWETYEVDVNETKLNSMVTKYMYGPYHTDLFI